MHGSIRKIVLLFSWCLTACTCFCHVRNLQPHLCESYAWHYVSRDLLMWNIHAQFTIWYVCHDILSDDAFKRATSYWLLLLPESTWLGKLCHVHVYVAMYNDLYTDKHNTKAPRETARDRERDSARSRESERTHASKWERGATDFNLWVTLALLSISRNPFLNAQQQRQHGLVIHTVKHSIQISPLGPS